MANVIQFSDGKYTGEIQNGKREGFGKLEQSWGGIYEGHFKNDKKDGQGSIIVPGSRYNGEWKDDKRSGVGTKVWTNGRRYEGEWADDEIEGQGRWRWGDGRFFQSKFKSDCPLVGTIMKSDGQVYKVTYDGKTDIADSSLRTTTKVLAEPVEAQIFQTSMASRRPHLRGGRTTRQGSRKGTRPRQHVTPSASQSCNSRKSAICPVLRPP